MNAPTNTPFNVTESSPTDSADSDASRPQQDGARLGVSKRLQIAMVIEIAFAFAGVFVLLAIGVAIWNSADLDWFSSIRRFQEMI